MKTAKSMIFPLLAACLMFFAGSCKNIHKSPDGAVVAFIIAAEQRDMTKAWNILSPELQGYYNGQGEKMRKSGKGALENEIAAITKFKVVKKDYTIEVDPADPESININLTGGQQYKIKTINIEGDYKIKDRQSIENLLTAITAETKPGDGY
jgi:outer membrane protein assembly factor BamA